MFCLQTCLATRFCHEEYTRQYYPTAGIDFFLKRTVLQGDRHLRVIVWDVSGQALKSQMIDKYLYAAQVGIYITIFRSSVVP